ncbi:hypothetical protein ACIRLA_46380 [Streptomyces sp. NPDC102364]|uniref:hypothetical protein n=1 Tax=Streptomyces sp. NPDC102364 TaxID=3366161 RepID=UPI00380C1AF7
MALPFEIQTTTVTATYTDWQGNPCHGSVTFEPCPCRMVTDNGTVIAGSLHAKLDANGQISVQLPTAGQAGLSPDDFCFVVTEEVDCLGCARSYSISTACADGETECSLDLSDVLNT